VTVHRELRDELRSVCETALDTAGKERLAELAEMVRKGVIKV